MLETHALLSDQRIQRKRITHSSKTSVVVRKIIKDRTRKLQDLGTQQRGHGVNTENSNEKLLRKPITSYQKEEASHDFCKIIPKILRNSSFGQAITLTVHLMKKQCGLPHVQHQIEITQVEVQTQIGVGSEPVEREPVCSQTEITGSGRNFERATVCTIVWRWSDQRSFWFEKSDQRRLPAQLGLIIISSSAL